MGENLSQIAQASGGCASCRYAGHGVDGSSISARLSKEQYEMKCNAGAHYYCVSLGRPVWSEQGKTCSSFRSDNE